MRIFAGLVFSIFFIVSVAGADQFPLNFSASKVDVTAIDTIRIHHVSAPWAEGSYWIDFQWDPANLAMIPVNAGAEPQPTGLTWNLSSSTYQAAIAADPAERSLTIYFKCIGPVCDFDAVSSVTPGCQLGLSFFQGNSFYFGLTTNSSQVNSSKAFVSALSSTSEWNVCGTLYYNEEVGIKITDLPQWFDFAKTFEVNNIGLYWDSWTLNPDGSGYISSF
ncbi:MAG: hypothetical protein P8013_12385 [Candidatus Sulfobium sp.]